MTSGRQAEYLGLQDFGRIELGARACLVKLDEDLRLQGVWVDGESLAPSTGDKSPAYCLVVPPGHTGTAAALNAET